MSFARNRPASELGAVKLGFSCLREGMASPIIWTRDHRAEAHRLDRVSLEQWTPHELKKLLGWCEFTASWLP